MPIIDHLTFLDLPFYIFNTNFLASFLIIVKPLTLTQVDGCELST